MRCQGHEFIKEAPLETGLFLKSPESMEAWLSPVEVLPLSIENLTLRVTEAGGV